MLSGVQLVSSVHATLLRDPYSALQRADKKQGGARLLWHRQQAASHVEELPFIQGSVHTRLIPRDLGVEAL
jgi:hypothetical protein